ncbi:TPA: DNA methyltransferase [Shigella flexneri]
MSRFVLGNCIDVMARIPDNAIDFILTDPPYLVGFRDRQGRTIAGDKTDEWLQPACNEMYRVLKKDALMVSFYGWNRVDRFMSAWKNAGFSVVGHLVFTKNYTSHMWAIATNAPTSWQKAVHVCHKTRCRTCWAGNIRATAITRRKSPLPACNR